MYIKVCIRTRSGLDILSFQTQEKLCNQVEVIFVDSTRQCHTYMDF